MFTLGSRLQETVKIGKNIVLRRKNYSLVNPFHSWHSLKTIIRKIPTTIFHIL
jgi:hypothetical protein